MRDCGQLLVLSLKLVDPQSGVDSLLSTDGIQDPSWIELPKQIERRIERRERETDRGHRQSERGVDI